VTLLDAGGLSALERFAEMCESRSIRVVLADLQAQPAGAMKAAGLTDGTTHIEVVPTLTEAVALARGG